ncbi:MAG: T9SS type A sorting domain-containing protein [Chitinophagales bacterium]|nr:T9SS type A sorting domain-containing protein [Chitinophagales bacterium]
MKKSLYFLFFIFLFHAHGMISAQPVITSSVFGTPGENYIMQGVAVDVFEAGDAGENVTWDFSSLSLSGATETRNIVESSTTIHADDYPEANVAIVVDDTSFTYYNISSALLSIYGTATPSITQIFEDPADLTDFPVTYNDTKDDTFSGTAQLLGFDATLEGVSSSVADGYGTIILPGGASYDDVLRSKILLNITGEVTGLPITGEINSIIYYWFKEGILGPVMQYTYTETLISGVPASALEFTQVNDALLVDIDAPRAQLFFHVYPNPSTDLLYVESGGDAYVTISNLQGNKMMTGEMINGGSINISSLPAGNYVMHVASENGSGSKIINIVR